MYYGQDKQWRKQDGKKVRKKGKMEQSEMLLNDFSPFSVRPQDF